MQDAYKIFIIDKVLACIIKCELPASTYLAARARRCFMVERRIEFPTIEPQTLQGSGEDPESAGGESVSW